MFLLTKKTIIFYFSQPVSAPGVFDENHELAAVREYKVAYCLCNHIVITEQVPILLHFNLMSI